MGVFGKLILSLLISPHRSAEVHFSRRVIHQRQPLWHQADATFASATPLRTHFEEIPKSNHVTRPDRPPWTQRLPP
ncbi:hypothetical protein GWI33_020962 [Rhynchophorus ferrugineus]|uniref:Uncharacterized protein n=1 Tax=Rhynchophorus ferrugineus TaxID=354439 RepID=A0A834HPR6_RHYFE|nr:hypothetical protein GWI33_020962 [Rhynchophorus ferrugineus]